jgi:hypothetical protein
MQQGKTDEASNLFRELADGANSRFIAPYALVSLGDIEKAAGKTKEAEDYYKRVTENFKGSPFTNLADQHLKLVNFQMPAEIEAPPAPVVPPQSEFKPDLSPGAGLTDDMKGNPLGGILNGEGATPAPPVEDTPAPPAQEAPAKPESEEPAKPDAAQPPQPQEGAPAQPQQ